MLTHIFADVEIFDNPDHEHNVVLDAEIKEYRNIEGNDVFIRIVDDSSNILEK